MVGLVLDSPFASLLQLTDDLSGIFLPSKVPKFAVSLGMKMVRKTIRNKAGFDLKVVFRLFVWLLGFYPCSWLLI